MNKEPHSSTPNGRDCNDTNGYDADEFKDIASREYRRIQPAARLRREKTRG